VEDAIAPEKVALIRQRVLEQAEGERLAGIAQKTPSGQNINCCVNKGACFAALIEQDLSLVQGGAVVEQVSGDLWRSDAPRTVIAQSIPTAPPPPPHPIISVQFFTFLHFPTLRFRHFSTRQLATPRPSLAACNACRL
jgi:hypothetical protein